MPRTLSETMLRGMMARQTGIITLLVAKLEHSRLDAPLYFVNNTEAISVNGQEYQPCGMDFAMPDENEDGIRTARVRIANIDQALTPMIRTARGEPQVTFTLVSSSNLAASPPEFDNLEIVMLPMQLYAVTYDRVKIEGTLRFETACAHQFPKDSYNPIDWRAMFP